MKKSLFITCCIIAAVAAVAGELTRTEIEAKLKKLEGSPLPADHSKHYGHVDKFGNGGCWEYTCPVCKSTNICSDYLPIEDIRKDAVETAKLGLNIKTDETEFCMKCSKHKLSYDYDKIIAENQTAVLTDTIRFEIYDPEADNKVSISFSKGEKVIIKSYDKNYAKVLKTNKIIGYIEEQQIQNGILKWESDVRIGPGMNYGSIGRLPQETKLEFVETQNASSDWKAVMYSFPKPLPIPRIILATGKGIQFAECPKNPKLYWIITIDNNKRKVEYNETDATILKAFLKGSNEVNIYGTKGFLKDHMGRLNELVGPVRYESGTKAGAK